MTRKKGRKKTISKVFTVILSIISLIFLILTISLNVVPFKYIVIIISLLVLIDLLLIKIMFSKRRYRRVIGLIISAILSAILVLASVYEINTLGFFDNFGANNYKTLNYKVLVLGDSAYEEIKDLKNQNIGFIKEENTDMVIKKFKKEIKFKTKYLEDTTELVNSLLEKDTEAIILEESKYTILEEENSDFKYNFDKIYTFSIDIETEKIDKAVDVTEEPFSVYISGIDSYGKITSVSRSDVNIVATVNPNTNKVILTSIPRDYYVKLHDTTGYKDKLTHAGIYGIETSVQTIEDLLDIDINYYVKVNFTSLIKVVDTLEGIDVYSKYNFTSGEGYRFKEGYNYLDGKKALEFVRTRKAFKEGDRVRGENQQAVLEAIINKAMSPKIITKYNKLLKSLEGSFVTNMDDKDITSLVKKQINNNDSWDISFINLNGTDGSEYTYSHSASKLYVMIPDEESVKTAQEKLQKVLN